MSKVIKAKVIAGRYQGEIVRITNISQDEMGRKNAACMLQNGTRANLRLTDLEVVQETAEPEIKKARTASMPFISGSTSSRTMTHTKNMAKNKVEVKNHAPSDKYTMAVCETCESEYNLEDRKGQAGKVTQCENCAEETESKMEGQMIFSHKTGATIEIKKNGELRHEAEIFDPKNKS